MCLVDLTNLAFLSEKLDLPIKSRDHWRIFYRRYSKEVRCLQQSTNYHCLYVQRRHPSHAEFLSGQFLGFKPLSENMLSDNEPHPSAFNVTIELQCQLSCMYHASDLHIPYYRSIISNDLLHQEVLSECFGIVHHRITPHLASRKGWCAKDCDTATYSHHNVIFKLGRNLDYALPTFHNELATFLLSC